LGEAPVTGEAADSIARTVGMSAETLRKAKAVKKAAEEDPEHFGDLLAKMDETNHVDAVHKELKKRQKPATPVADEKPATTPSKDEKRDAGSKGSRTGTRKSKKSGSANKPVTRDEKLEYIKKHGSSWLYDEVMAGKIKVSKAYANLQGEQPRAPAETSDEINIAVPSAEPGRETIARLAALIRKLREQLEARLPGKPDGDHFWKCSGASKELVEELYAATTALMDFINGRKD
jgi:hypothetical protein